MTVMLHWMPGFVTSYITLKTELKRDTAFFPRVNAVKDTHSSQFCYFSLLQLSILICLITLFFLLQLFLLQLSIEIDMSDESKGRVYQ